MYAPEQYCIAREVRRSSITSTLKACKMVWSTYLRRTQRDCSLHPLVQVFVPASMQSARIGSIYIYRFA